jgi:hypothetical protein
MDLVEILVLGLATWRIASLFANEDGPFDMFSHIRNFIGVKTDANGNRYGTHVLSKGIICVWCNSIWFGILIAIAWVLFNPILYVCLPFALSTIAVMVEEGINGKS